MASFLITCLLWLVGLVVLGMTAPAGLGMRRRGRADFQRAKRFTSAGTSQLATPTDGLARFEVKALALGPGARAAKHGSSPAVCRGTLVEALLDDAWVECFSVWRGSLLVEDVAGQRAYVTLKRMLVVASLNDADGIIVQRLPEILLDAARARGVLLKRRPWMYARRWRTRSCEIRPGESLWILGAARTRTESVAAPDYRSTPESSGSRIVSGEANPGTGARELVVVKAGSLVDAKRLLARRAFRYSYGAVLIATGMLLFFAAVVAGFTQLPPLGRGSSSGFQFVPYDAPR